MLLTGLLASVELGLNRVLRLDSTALPRLAHLTGKVIAVDCRSPALQLFILPSDEGLMLAAHWETAVDCTLRAPASSLVKLAMSKDKTAVLHAPEVELDGDVVGRGVERERRQRAALDQLFEIDQPEARDRGQEDRDLGRHRHLIG